MNTLSLRDQRTMAGICRLLSLACEMIMQPQFRLDSKATQLPSFKQREIIGQRLRCPVWNFSVCVCGVQKVVLAFLLPVISQVDASVKRKPRLA